MIVVILKHKIAQFSCGFIEDTEIHGIEECLCILILGSLILLEDGIDSLLYLFIGRSVLEVVLIYIDDIIVYQLHGNVSCLVHIIGIDFGSCVFSSACIGGSRIGLGFIRSSFIGSGLLVSAC